MRKATKYSKFKAEFCRKSNIHYSKAYTLLESLIVLMLMGLLLVLTLPAFSSLTRQQSTTLANTLVAAVHFARAQALLQQEVTQICPSEDGMVCEQNWSAKYLLVATRSRLSELPKILYIVSLPVTRGQLSWRGFGSGAYPQFNPSGDSFQYNGTWYYCAAGREQLQNNRRISLSITGKVTVTAGETC